MKVHGYYYEFRTEPSPDVIEVRYGRVFSRIPVADFMEHSVDYEMGGLKSACRDIIAFNRVPDTQSNGENARQLITASCSLPDSKGTMHDLNVCFKDYYGTHRFDDDEIQNLLHGEEVSFNIVDRETNGLKKAFVRLVSPSNPGIGVIRLDLTARGTGARLRPVGLM